MYIYFLKSFEQSMIIISSCENCKRILNEGEELKTLVKSLESTVKNLNESIKSLTNSKFDSDVIKNGT